jgi:hypothetical protein
MMRPGSDSVPATRRARLVGGALGVTLALALAGCSSSGGDDAGPDPAPGSDTTAATAPAPSTSQPLPRTPGVDPFPVPIATAGVSGADVCARSRDAVASVLGAGGTATPDAEISRCSFLRAGVTFVVTLYPYDAYPLARANAFQTSDGDLEVTIAKRKATWFAGPGVSASRMLVQMSDLASLLVERNGASGAETQRAELTRVAEALLPLFETIEPPPLPTVPVGPVEPLVPPSTTSTTLAPVTTGPTGPTGSTPSTPTDAAEPATPSNAADAATTAVAAAPGPARPVRS